MEECRDSVVCVEDGEQINLFSPAVKLNGNSWPGSFPWDGRSIAWYHPLMLRTVTGIALSLLAFSPTEQLAELPLLHVSLVTPRQSTPLPSRSLSPLVPYRPPPFLLLFFLHRCFEASNNHAQWKIASEKPPWDGEVRALQHHDIAHNAIILVYISLSYGEMSNIILVLDLLPSTMQYLECLMFQSLYVIRQFTCCSDNLAKNCETKQFVWEKHLNLVKSTIVPHKKRRKNMREPGLRWRHYAKSRASD